MTMTEQHCKNLLTELHKSMPLSNTQALKNGEIVVNGFMFKDVTHVKLTGHGDRMEFLHFLRNGETLAKVDVLTVRGMVFTHSLTDKKVMETMLKSCPNLKCVHNS